MNPNSEVDQLEISAVRELRSSAREVDQLEIDGEVDHIECRWPTHQAVQKIPLSQVDGESVVEVVVGKGSTRGLVLSRYRPDLKQQRVRDRISSSLDRFLFAYRGRELQLHRNKLEESFGSHGNPMFKWLKAKLLRSVRNHSAEAHRSTTYKVNQSGFDDLWKLIHQEAFNYPEQRAKQLAPKLQPYFDGSEDLPLWGTVEGGRLYGPHLEMERDVKTILLAGCWDYDVQVAMPTLVLQSIPEWESRFPRWRKYLGNRRHYRTKLAQEFHCTEQQAKEVFQFLFSGATFNGSRHGVGAVLNSHQLKKAMNDEWVWGLYVEAKEAWSSLGLPSSRGPDRFRYYEQLEQRVMHILYSRLNHTKTRSWPFHDGFTVIDGERPDIYQLQDAVREETGFVIALEEKQL